MFLRLGVPEGKHRQMEKEAVGNLGICIYIVLYSSVIIQINSWGQMVGLSSHAG